MHKRLLASSNAFVAALFAMPLLLVTGTTNAEADPIVLGNFAITVFLDTSDPMFPGTNIDVAYSGITTTVSYITTGGGYVQQSVCGFFSVTPETCAGLTAGTVGLGTATGTMTETSSVSFTNTGSVGERIVVFAHFKVEQATFGSSGPEDVEQVSLSGHSSAFSLSGLPPSALSTLDFTCTPGNNCPGTGSTNGDEIVAGEPFIDPGQTITYDFMARVTVSASEVPEPSSLLLLSSGLASLAFLRSRRRRKYLLSRVSASFSTCTTDAELSAMTRSFLA
jgi:hypothetical protein